MYRVGRFEKVSYEQFKEAAQDLLGSECQLATAEQRIKWIYDKIRLPERATKGSAGYDFFSPVAFALKPGETIKIPTGIRVRISSGWFLAIFPRSGLGFKYRLQLNNTVGIIDSDYYYSDNEGHIFAKITNDSNEDKTVTINPGDAFMQGIFLNYGLTIDDAASGVRNGGMGSTSVPHVVEFGQLAA